MIMIITREVGHIVWVGLSPLRNKVTKRISTNNSVNFPMPYDPHTLVCVDPLKTNFTLLTANFPLIKFLCSLLANNCIWDIISLCILTKTSTICPSLAIDHSLSNCSIEYPKSTVAFN